MVLTSVARRSSLTFEEFYAQEFGRVYRSAWLIARTDHDAHDATQEAFARAFARWSRLGDEDWATGWVITTAVNVLRRRSKRASHTVVEEQSTSRLPEQTVDLQRALRRLPPRQREAVVLYYVADLSVHTVAHVMGVSDGTIKAHLAKGREALKGMLEVRHV